MKYVLTMCGLLTVICFVAVDASAWPFPEYTRFETQAMSFDALVDSQAYWLDEGQRPVGEGGYMNSFITTDPETALPAEPYFYHYAATTGMNGATNVGYTGVYAIAYPASSAAIQIESYLDHYMYSGSTGGITRAEGFADWILGHLTPAGYAYHDVPWSTVVVDSDETTVHWGAGWDNGAIIPLNTGMLGTQLVRLYHVTGDTTYINAAVKMADALVENQYNDPGDLARYGSWPFKAMPDTGVVQTESGYDYDYSTNNIQTLPFLKAVAEYRAANPGANPASFYSDAADRLWSWVENNPLNPASDNYYYFAFHGIGWDVNAASLMGEPGSMPAN